MDSSRGRLLGSIRSAGWRLGCAFVLALLGLGASAAEPTLGVRGNIELELNVALLADHGAYLMDAPPPADTRDSYLRWPPALLAGDLVLASDKDGAARPQSGRAGFAAGLLLQRADGVSLRLAKLYLGSPRGDGEWALADDAGAVWLSARAGFPLTHVGEPRRRWVLIDLQAGDALAEWLQRPLLAGQSVGRMSLELDAPALDKGAPGCPLNWPGTPGFEVDVALVALYQLQAQCANGPCDGGAAGSNVPRIKLTPATTLRNVGSADVPWVSKFLTMTTASQLELTHPYPQPDQHPMLVWNAYRLDPDGRLMQIGRSALKHAFATENLGCTCNPGNHQILGPGCSDRYDVGSNDLSSALAPRSEVIAHDGRWGRCGSLFDPDCIGSQTFTDASTNQRLLLAETDIDPLRHPDARWFVDAWYVVRDDIEPFNTMGWREFRPRYVNGVWLTDLIGEFSQGALVDHWAALPVEDGWQLGTRVSTAQGELQLGVRVHPLNARQARYEYAMLNHSLGRAQTAAAEPNLRVLANPGLVEVGVPLAGSRGASIATNNPGAGAAPWQSACAEDTLQLSAPPSDSLAWGSMLRWSVIADAPPQKGALRLRAAGDAPEDAILAPSLVPSASPLAIFGDGFDPCG